MLTLVPFFIDRAVASLRYRPTASGWYLATHSFLRHDAPALVQNIRQRFHIAMGLGIGAAFAAHLPSCSNDIGFRGEVRQVYSASPVRSNLLKALTVEARQLVSEGRTEMISQALKGNTLIAVVREDTSKVDVYAIPKRPAGSLGMNHRVKVTTLPKNLFDSPHH